MRMASHYVLVPSHEREEEVDFGGDYMGEWSSADSGEESEETEAYPPVKVIIFMASDQVIASHNISGVTQKVLFCFPCRARRSCTRAMPLQGRAIVCSPPILAARKRKRRRRRRKKEHLLLNPLSL